MKLPKCTSCGEKFDSSEVNSSGLIICRVCGKEFTLEWYQKQRNLLNPDVRKTFVLDCRKVGSLDDFYDEVHRVLCPGFKGFGRNWYALKDILRGGFRVFDIDEHVSIILQGMSVLEKNLSEGEVKMIRRIFTEADNIDFQMK